MYYQTVHDLYSFVLDPVYTNPLGSYVAKDGDIRALVTNKKEIKRFLDNCFTEYDYEYVGKLGSWNRYNVTLKGPIRCFDRDTCSVSDDPLFMETILFYMDVTQEEIDKKNQRPKLLSDFVLRGAHPTQFLKLLRENFTMEKLIDTNLFRIKPKQVEANNTDSVAPSNT